MAFLEVTAAWEGGDRAPRGRRGGRELGTWGSGKLSSIREVSGEAGPLVLGCSGGLWPWGRIS